MRQVPTGRSADILSHTVGVVRTDSHGVIFNVLIEACDEVLLGDGRE